MARWTKVRWGVFRLSNSILLLIAGAWLLTQYFKLTEPALKTLMRDTAQSLNFALLVTAIIGALARPREDRPASTWDISPRWSGMLVVVATGFAAVLFIALADASQAYLLPALIVGTLVVATIVWRFATRHAADIGEARFETPPPAA